jgi:hypothetical protein
VCHSKGLLRQNKWTWVKISRGLYNFAWRRPGVTSTTAPFIEGEDYFYTEDEVYAWVVNNWGRHLERSERALPEPQVKYMLTSCGLECCLASADLQCCMLQVQQQQEQQQQQQDGQQAPVSPASSVATVHRSPAPTDNGDYMDEDDDDCQIIDPRDMQQRSSSSSGGATPGSAKAAAAPQALFFPTPAAAPAAAAAAVAATAPMAPQPVTAAAAAGAATAAAATRAVPFRHQLDLLVSCTTHLQASWTVFATSSVLTVV